MAYSATTPPAAHCEAGCVEFLTQTCPSRGAAVNAGSFSVVVIASKHVCMFIMVGANQKGPC